KGRALRASFGTVVWAFVARAFRRLQVGVCTAVGASVGTPVITSVRRSRDFGLFPGLECEVLRVFSGQDVLDREAFDLEELLLCVCQKVGLGLHAVVLYES